METVCLERQRLERAVGSLRRDLEEALLGSTRLENHSKSPHGPLHSSGFKALLNPESLEL